MHVVLTLLWCKNKLSNTRKRVYAILKKIKNGAVILTKRYLMAKTMGNISSNEYIGTSLFNNSKSPIYLFSVCCRPSKNLSTSIDPTGKFPHLKNSFICMDSNAKNKLWGSKTTDGKSSKLEDIFIVCTK